MKESEHGPLSFWQVLFRILLGLIGAAALMMAVLLIGFKLAHVTNGEIVSGGEERVYAIYVPETAAEPAPLVISLHGFSEWPALHQHVTGWQALADEEGFIVVYPAGTGFPLRWLAFPREENAAISEKDVIFISDLIAALSAEYQVDPERIYVDGFSNGAGMATRLACELSDQIAAIAGVAGAYVVPLDACEPERPMPFISVHGDADEIVPYHGGPSHMFDVPFTDVPEYMAGWAERNGCEAQPVTLEQQGDASGIAYTGCDGGADVIFYTISGGGHAWPGGEPLPERIVGYTSDDLNTTAVLWEFFSNHTLTTDGQGD